MIGGFEERSMNTENAPTTITVDNESMNPKFRQSHDFVFSPQSYSSTEEMIIALLCSRENVHQVQDDMPVEEMVKFKPKAYLFKTEILETWFETETKNLYSRLQTATKNLMQTITTIGEDGRTFQHENFFTRCVFNADGLYMLPSQAFYDRLFLSKNGFAEIDQPSFISLKSNQHAMRLFRLLSRFKNGKSKLYKIEIEKLKQLFGIYDDNFEVKKKSYIVTSAFLKKILIPAVQSLIESDLVSHRLKFYYDEDDTQKKHIGIKKHMHRGKVTHIEFLYEWFAEENYLPHTYNYSKKEAYTRLRELITLKNTRQLSLDELYEAKACLEIHEKFDHAQQFEDEINKVLAEKAEKENSVKPNDDYDFNFLS